MTGPAKILAVDDEPDFEALIRQRFRQRIRTKDLEFRFARHGEEALAVLAEEPDIELLLLDINMPVMDGLALLAELRARRSPVRAVIVSAYGDMANIRTAMNRGAFDFVTKPVDFADLEVTVDKTLESIAEVRKLDCQRAAAERARANLARYFSPNLVEILADRDEPMGDGFIAIGDAQDGPYAISDNTLQLVDTLSWVHGKHSLRFGFEYTRQNFNQVGNQFSRGQFAFQPNATQSSSKTGGDAFAEFLLGDLYQSIVAVAIAKADFQRNTYHAFVDDTYKVTPKLTLSLGLRYELTPPWVNQFNNQFLAFIPQIVAVSNAPASLTPYMVRQGNCTDPYAGPPPINIRWTTVDAKCSNGALPDALLRTSYRDWAPRVGLAFSPDARTVVRAGFGVFYNQEIGNAYFDLARNIGGRVTLTSNIGTPSLFYSNAVPGGSGTTANVPSPYAYSMAVSHRTSYVTQYLFNIQREMGGNWAFEAGYLGGQSHHLQGFMDANQGIPGTVGNAQSRRPFPGFSNIQLVHDGGNGNYNSLSVKATRRFGQGLSVVSSYTWSKSIDTTSGIRNQGNDTLYPQNMYCLACERGLSAFDVRHRTVTSVLYDLPVGKGRRANITNPVLNLIAGGWNLGGILTLQSGMPGNLGLGGVDNASTGSGGYDRPNSTGVSPYLSNPTPSRYFSLDAFTEAPAGQFGNVGRTAIVGPGIIGFDASIHKSFKMPYKDSHALQFRFEAFNVLNHPNWAMPNLNILSGATVPGKTARDTHQGFGVVSGTSIAMRQIQLGLKYSF